MATHRHHLFCIGNPLLDMQVTNGEDLLKKYNLKSNDAIRAGEQHAPIYEEMVKDYNVTYVAGGAAQNAARAAAYILPPETVVYCGAVGDDELAEQLRTVNNEAGVESAYQTVEGERTGACAVIITGHDRSLVTTLRAAAKFNESHLSTPAVATLLDEANLIYTSGFFISHGIESALHVARKASENGKVVALNLSAPHIPRSFKAQLDSILPFADIVIGNESEAEAWGEAADVVDKKDLESIARSIALLPKANYSRHRLVIITHGAEPTTVVSAASPNEPKVYPVKKLSEEEIVDTNGAGDAFAGAFLGAYLLGKSVDQAIEAGHRLGAICVGQVGAQFKWPKVNILD